MTRLSILKPIFLAMVLVVFAGCADDSSGNSVPTDNVELDENWESIEYAQGMIKGRQWKYLQGRASIFKRNNKDFLEIRLWNDRFDNPCSVALGSKVQVRMYVPLSRGSWRIDPNDPFSLIPTLIFSDYGVSNNSKVNLIADEGMASVNLLDNNNVAGVVSAQFKPKDEGRTKVYGKFNVPFCTTFYGSD
ncbi:hypothetical protein [Bdellovibrio sp. GT3]|uniref:hypothetical protein n=1 Tax=Bdellovibrio sp. GT3 TaxID=3136282 RepID=UPI0030F08621